MSDNRMTEPPFVCSVCEVYEPGWKRAGWPWRRHWRCRRCGSEAPAPPWPVGQYLVPGWLLTSSMVASAVFGFLMGLIANG